MSQQIENQQIEKVIQQLREENISPTINAIENKYRELYDDTFIFLKEKRNQFLERFENFHQSQKSKQTISNETIMKKCEEELKLIEKKLVQMQNVQNGRLQNENILWIDEIGFQLFSLLPKIVTYHSQKELNDLREKAEANLKKLTEMKNIQTEKVEKNEKENEVKDIFETQTQTQEEMKIINERENKLSSGLICVDNLGNLISSFEVLLPKHYEMAKHSLSTNEQIAAFTHINNQHNTIPYYSRNDFKNWFSTSICSFIKEHWQGKKYLLIFDQYFDRFFDCNDGPESETEHYNCYFLPSHLSAYISPFYRILEVFTNTLKQNYFKKFILSKTKGTGSNQKFDIFTQIMLTIKSQQLMNEIKNQLKRNKFSQFQLGLLSQIVKQNEIFSPVIMSQHEEEYIFELMTKNYSKEEREEIEKISENNNTTNTPNKTNPNGIDIADHALISIKQRKPSSTQLHLPISIGTNRQLKRKDSKPSVTPSVQQPLNDNQKRHMENEYTGLPSMITQSPSHSQQQKTDRNIDPFAGDEFDNLPSAITHQPTTRASQTSIYEDFRPPVAKPVSSQEDERKNTRFQSVIRQFLNSFPPKSQQLSQNSQQEPLSHIQNHADVTTEVSRLINHQITDHELYEFYYILEQIKTIKLSRMYFIDTIDHLLDRTPIITKDTYKRFDDFSFICCVSGDGKRFHSVTLNHQQYSKNAFFQYINAICNHITYTDVGTEKVIILHEFFRNYPWNNNIVDKLKSCKITVIFLDDLFFNITPVHQVFREMIIGLIESRNYSMEATENMYHSINYEMLLENNVFSEIMETIQSPKPKPSSFLDVKQIIERYHMKYDTIITTRMLEKDDDEEDPPQTRFFIGNIAPFYQDYLYKHLISHEFLNLKNKTDQYVFLEDLRKQLTVDFVSIFDLPSAFGPIKRSFDF